MPFCPLISMGRPCRRRARRNLCRFPGQATQSKLHHLSFPCGLSTPANSTFTTFATPTAAGFTALCPTHPRLRAAEGSHQLKLSRWYWRSSHVPAALSQFWRSRISRRQLTASSSGGVAGMRWFELRNVTSGPVTVYQQSTYQPDTTWRWMGSAAMDGQGNLALGFSASSSSINPQLRYAGRLATDPLNTLAQGEAHLLTGPAARPAAAIAGAITARSRSTPWMTPLSGTRTSITPRPRLITGGPASAVSSSRPAIRRRPRPQPRHRRRRRPPLRRQLPRRRQLRPRHLHRRRPRRLRRRPLLRRLLAN